MAATLTLRLALALIAPLAGCHDEADPWRDLVADHVTTTGRIGRLDCGAHPSMRYAFTAGAQTYDAQASDDDFDCRTARIGDPVLVYYAPLAPEISTLLPPEQAYARSRGHATPAAGWLALVGIVAVTLSLVAKLRTACHAT
jgi:hypothetical protein